MLADVSFEHRDGITVAHVRGEIDLSNARELGTAIDDVIVHVAAGLVIDFSETSYLDSAGLHFVFDLGKRLRDRGQHLVLVVPADSSIEPVLRITGVEMMAPVSRTLDEALGRLHEHEADVPSGEE
jgi:anti-sigma B factor antagonist